MDLQLSGKQVLISGGSRGIGLAIAHAFAAEGCSVMITGRTKSDLEKAQQDIGRGTEIFVADATDPDACAKLADQLQRTWGKLDILITSAGSGASVLPGQETAAEWQRVVAQNLFSATNMIAAFTPLLEKAAPSSIVCLSSICGREALGAPVTYSAAKAALDATVNNLSRPLAKKGIRINAVSPGNIYFANGTWDRKLKDNPEAVNRMLAAEVPMGCLGKPEWIADAVAFLASPRSCFTTGANLVVDGGQTRS